MAKTAGRPPRSESDIAEYRSKIAKQALAIYRAEGFDAVSMRRLAKEVGCAPMTIYAHFEGKHDILRYLWADVLADMSSEIQGKLERIDAPAERLQMAAHTFVSYWVDHPDHFRLVFMSNDVTRSDVSTFVMDEETLAHFQMFSDLVQDILQNESNVKASTDTLISGMIGIALCLNTIRDYPWTYAKMMTDRLLTGIISPVDTAS
ncbi:TetR/AcrR family transcriptional regulator [Sulfitobacter sp. SK012]|jgi:AcrR family transcriptional regulator|uniref:TetR/AcrR family transcriptional regulator n=1 Tax=Sulfitobacter sp. SK012 TaxID=1389005 RepID=UPI000E0A863E|nr:TetR/AcrR family transcriptional regulator [Sulfitobacter sp. SK012]AXI46404.1 TetR/AcrR family transcriptional regulator [Sulfitobacter sp. SK012]